MRKKLLVAMMVVFTVSVCALAAERRPLQDVEADAITSDTQVTVQGAGDNHAAIVWWIPNEFWQAILSRDNSSSGADKKAMLEAMSGVSLLAVVQADITSLGAFQFYPKEEIEKNMKITFTGADGKTQVLLPLKTINPDLEVVLGVFKPGLGAAMGNLGNNMHFYVLSDVTDDSGRLIDPYQQGKIDIQLAKRYGGVMTTCIELPLNSLFVPRRCPNGKDAHISWHYCPWTGERLED